MNAPAMQRTVLLLMGTIMGTSLATFVGCGGPVGVPVAGQVGFSDGSPVRSGRIEFRSEDSKHRAMGEIDSEGRFHLTAPDGVAGLPAGDYDVIVVQLIITEDLALEAHADGGHGRRVPRRYADYYTSGLRATVTANGPNELQITLDP